MRTINILAVLQVCARAVPSELAAAIIQIETRKLKPYAPGSAVGIATAIDEHMGFVKAA